MLERSIEVERVDLVSSLYHHACRGRAGASAFDPSEPFLCGLKNSAEQLSSAQYWERIWEWILTPFRVLEAVSAVFKRRDSDVGDAAGESDAAQAAAGPECLDSDSNERVGERNVGEAAAA